MNKKKIPGYADLGILHMGRAGHSKREPSELDDVSLELIEEVNKPMPITVVGESLDAMQIYRATANGATKGILGFEVSRSDALNLPEEVPVIHDTTSSIFYGVDMASGVDSLGFRRGEIVFVGPKKVYPSSMDIFKLLAEQKTTMHISLEDPFGWRDGHFGEEKKVVRAEELLEHLLKIRMPSSTFMFHRLTKLMKAIRQQSPMDDAKKLSNFSYILLHPNQPFTTAKWKPQMDFETYLSKYDIPPKKVDETHQFSGDTLLDMKKRSLRSFVRNFTEKSGLFTNSAMAKYLKA